MTAVNKAVQNAIIIKNIQIENRNQIEKKTKQVKNVYTNDVKRHHGRDDFWNREGIDIIAPESRRRQDDEAMSGYDTYGFELIC